MTGAVANTKELNALFAHGSEPVVVHPRILKRGGPG